jgi:hypothetical protein
LSGADDFSDLILTAVGKGTLISWGTGDDILVEGITPGQLIAADFSFGAASVTSNAAVVDSLSHGPSSHWELALTHAAIDLASHAYLVG